MRRTILILLCSILLISSLSFASVNGTVFAQEEAESAEVEETNSRGPGAVILMIGIAALAGVGAVYGLRRDNTPNNEAKS